MHDDTVRLWDAEGREGPVLTVREGATLIGVTWTADGRELIAASDDGFVRSWNGRTLVAHWIAFQSGPFNVARFGSRCRYTLFNAGAMNSLTYLVAKPDGSVALLNREEFYAAAGWRDSPPETAIPDQGEGPANSPPPR